MHSLQPTLDGDDDDGDDGNADGGEAITCFDQKLRGTLEFCTLGEVVA